MQTRNDSFNDLSVRMLWDEIHRLALTEQISTEDVRRIADIARYVEASCLSTAETMIDMPVKADSLSILNRMAELAHDIAVTADRIDTLSLVDEEASHQQFNILGQKLTALDREVKHLYFLTYLKLIDTEALPSPSTEWESESRAQLQVRAERALADAAAPREQLANMQLLNTQEKERLAAHRKAGKAGKAEVEDINDRIMAGIIADPDELSFFQTAARVPNAVRREGIEHHGGPNLFDTIANPSYRSTKEAVVQGIARFLVRFFEIMRDRGCDLSGACTTLINEAFRLQVDAINLLRIPSNDDAFAREVKDCVGQIVSMSHELERVLGDPAKFEEAKNKLAGALADLSIIYRQSQPTDAVSLFVEKAKQRPLRQVPRDESPEAPDSGESKRGFRP
ncbi:MAG TPA: hypothetical protein VNC84_00620 [Gammaproteobacteria bacterium]|nr:hypothetical protein [Gammaproteobacteria bacterium]